jgi:hypothetical protein
MKMYIESKKKIDEIRRNDEILFRMAISHLMDVGIRHLTNELVEETCEDIMKQDDSKAFITNEYKCDILRKAYELAQIPHIDLLVYIQREVDYDVHDNGMNYSRAMELLKNCVNWIEMQYEDDATALDRLENLEFEEEDLVAVGLDYLIEEENE